MIRIMIDDAFMARVQPLYVPEMGTESTGPLLYWLIRTLRPLHVLEVGMGYTTLFLAKALQDNIDALTGERAMIDADAVDDLPLAYLDYYAKPYEPKLICIDRMKDSMSTAPQAVAALQDLGLADVCSVIKGNLRGASQEVRDRLGLVDFAWVDTWDTLAFLREYWHLVNPAGGMLAIHYIMTYPEGRAVQHYIRSLGRVDGKELEITNLCEPHKTAQNSLTLIRRMRDYVEPEDLRRPARPADPESLAWIHRLIRGVALVSTMGFPRWLRV